MKMSNQKEKNWKICESLINIKCIVAYCNINITQEDLLKLLIYLIVYDFKSTYLIRIVNVGHFIQRPMKNCEIYKIKTA